MLEKRLNFSEIESRKISEWYKEKLFRFESSKKSQPYTIIMPPPNVTGSLHMGHALTFTLQDILIRFYKKLDKNVLWQPGTDHAGIATEIIVEKKLLKEKNKSKIQLGREEFLEQVWKWKKQSGDNITEQLKRLGTSIDWTISKFTLDEECSVSVKKAFIDLYNSGYIYQDERLVNWDPKLQTAVSDLEVSQKEIDGNLWFIKYKLYDSNEFLVVATTRPETMFGDTAVAIHPKNPELKSFIGRKVIVPIVNKVIPVIADDYADPDKGSGAVKITPAHDFNDFIIGKKHNLNFINIFDTEAKLNDNVPNTFIGLDRFEARKKIIKKLNNENLIKKTLKNKMFVPFGERTGVIIEPLLTKQWFLDSKKLCIEVNKSIKKNEIKFYPESWMNTFKHWINNIEPWCISRQIWWGHRIPIWYTEKGKKIAAMNLEDAKNILRNQKTDDKILRQEDDVLDTWFSSALWPFSSLGWPKKNKILDKHYPSNVLVTGFDIIFFWVARMIMMGLYFLKKVPFKNIYIHPLVKDEKGEKMSKSKGNVIDPLELIKLYGADSLRFTLANLSTQGRDIKLSNKLVENSRNFLTKIWNVARFSEFNNFIFDKEFQPNSNKLIVNDWILIRLFETKKKILKNLNEYKFNLLLNDLYHFVWHDFCDLYIEFCKVYIKDKNFSKEISNNFSFVYKVILNLLNPIVPFVTEEISRKLNYSDSSLFNEKLDYKILNFKKEKKNIIEFEKLILFIKTLRSEYDENAIKKSSLLIFSNLKIKWIDTFSNLLKPLLGLEKIVYSQDVVKSKFFIVSNIKFSLDIKDKENQGKEDLNQKIQFYKNEIEFFEKKLNNKNFLEKAPTKIVDENRNKLDEARKNLKLLKVNV